MRALIQRVSSASVSVQGHVVSAIETGWLVLLGVSATDTQDHIPYLTEKIINLRGFDDADGKMNLSILDIKGEILVVSQFTLYADVSKGRRPGFSLAAKAEPAKSLYELFCRSLKDAGVTVKQGTFQAHMDVNLVNSGPVTFMIEH
jgi:D-tyrosyl-tRNA(Tyr) deacylase